DGKGRLRPEMRCVTRDLKECSSHAVIFDRLVKIRRYKESEDFADPWFTLSNAELFKVEFLARHWAKVRDSWAEYRGLYYGVDPKTRKVQPGARWGYISFRRPGKNSKEVHTYSIRWSGHKIPHDFKHKQVRNPLDPPVEIGEGIVQTHALYRKGEDHGRPEGECEVAHYRITHALHADAYRDELWLIRGADSLLLSGYEEDFLTAIAEIVKNPPSLSAFV
ncbi:MAG: hypothetical protein ACREJQ_07560, partial [bacterium]